MSYLRKERGCEKLGVHGESLGGMIAAHVGKTCYVDFLFADRTFSSLGAVAWYGVHKVGLYLIKHFKRWEYDSAADFLASPGYKVISADPNDAIINDMASLKTGVVMGYWARL